MTAADPGPGPLDAGPGLLDAGPGGPDDMLLPTSFAQRRLWLVDRMQPGSSAYNVPVAVRLRGRLDVAALHRALADIVDRHEVLRTTFAEQDGEPVQVIRAQAAVGLPVRQVSGEAAVAAGLRAAAAAPFDLAAGPLLRCELLLVGPAEHVLLVTAHHIVIDGWSLGVFFRDLSELYVAHAAGRPAELPELPAQYGDFAAWQREHLAAGALRADADYWRGALAGAPTVLELPTEFPRQRRSADPGAILGTRLPADLTDDLDELSAACGSTLFMTLLAGFGTLLSRYSGSADVVVGSPIAGRIRPELENLVGCFINTLPLRVDLSGRPSFRQLLARVRAVALAGYQHQNLSFEQIVDLVRPDRAAAETPIFQVMFAVDNTPPPAVAAGEVTFEFLPPYRNQVKYDLNITVSRDGDELEVGAEYRTDLFGPGWMRRLLGHLATLLAAAVADPDRPVDRLPLLTPAELGELASWNDTAVDYPDAGASLPELVERQVDATPDAAAVVFDTAVTTYRDLDRWANQVAHQLRAHGVGRGDRVGLCLQRSAALVAAALGVLKAGAAYLPLDPGYPAARREFMVADAGVAVVLTHPPVRDRVPAAVPVVLDVTALPPGPAGRPAAAAGSADPAYVIYTSGSTGTPKAVVNNHAGIVNRLLWMQQEYRLDHTDVVLHKTPYSFDVSVWELFWPLLAGARVVVAAPAGHKDPAYLQGVLTRHQVTTVHFVPSMLRLFLDSADLGSCRWLRRVICSGEELPADLARRYHAAGPTGALHNLYGPTEAAIDVSHWPCRPGAADPVVPIGRPVANTSLYLLDQHDTPVPVGVPGELCVGGVQVAAGYLGRPELTAQRFGPDPFRPGRMYRTGDLARWRADGAVEYLGRLDDQVKLRGFRIELGEVTAAIRAEDGVRDAVVVARDDRLVGYVVGDADRIGSAGLRERLATRLPDYLVPARVVWLDALPLSANGKVDRAALPDPSSAELRDGGARVGARDSLELELTLVWEQVLGVRGVGVTDDFFALGGNSLQAVRLLGRIARAQGRELPLSMLFTGSATVERVARALRQAPDARAWSPVVPIRPTGTLPPLFCLPPAVGNVLCYLDLAAHLPAEQPVYGLQAAGLDPGQQPVERLADGVERYVAAIRSVQPAGPYAIAGYCVGSVSAYAVAQRLRAQGSPVALLAVLDGGPANPDSGFDTADAADLAAWFGWELGRAADRRLELDPEPLRRLPAGELADAVLRAAVAADVLPADSDSRQVARLLATFTAGVRAVRDHPLTPYDGPMLAIRAAEEPDDTSPVARWRPLTSGQLVLRTAPGDHYTMMRPPHVGTLAGLLAAELDRARSGRAGGPGSAGGPGADAGRRS
jgi:amino acid adenylation domain-containing protein